MASKRGNPVAKESYKDGSPAEEAAESATFEKAEDEAPKKKRGKRGMK